MGRHGAALQLLGMKWRPEASYEGPGIPLRGRTFLRKALLHPAAIVFRVVAPCSAPPKPLTPSRQTAGAGQRMK